MHHGSRKDPDPSLKGAWTGSVVLMEFPSHDAPMAWYNSREYQAILPLRAYNTISDIILIDQLPADFTVEAFAASVRRTLAAR